MLLLVLGPHRRCSDPVGSSLAAMPVARAKLAAAANATAGAGREDDPVVVQGGVVGLVDGGE
eukprot:939431-Alexandrium_andersonii.AAC.1